MSTPRLADEAAPARSPLLGVLAFLIALVAYLGLPILISALGPTATPELVDALPLIVFGAVAVLGIVAAVAGRGRGWAVAAIVIAVANPASPVHDWIVSLLGTFAG